MKTLFVAVLASFLATAAGAETQVLNTLPFAVDVREAVRSECKLQTLLPEFIETAGADIKLVGSFSGNGRRLELKITEVHAPGGGAFSGPKWIEVVGTLRGDGKPKTFRAKRLSTGLTMRGTCSILARAAKATGLDIAAWLKDPKDGAELGDAR